MLILRTYQLTQLKIRDLLARMMGVDFSAGTILQAHGKAAQALAAPTRDKGRQTGAPSVAQASGRVPILARKRRQPVLGGGHAPGSAVQLAALTGALYGT